MDLARTVETCIHFYIFLQTDILHDIINCTTSKFNNLQDLMLLDICQHTHCLFDINDNTKFQQSPLLALMSTPIRTELPLSLSSSF